MTKPDKIFTKLKNIIQLNKIKNTIQLKKKGTKEEKEAIKTVKRPSVLNLYFLQIFNIPRMFKKRARIIMIFTVLVLFISGSILLINIIELFNTDNNARKAKDGINANDSNSNSNQLKDIEELIVHKTIITKINGLEQVINILEADLSTGQAKVKPVLSHDSLFGFEFLSQMAERHGAYAAVNGGFFYEYGEPSGMVVIDGEIFTGSTGEYPVFIVSNSKAELKQFKTELYLTADRDDADCLRLDNINVAGKPGEWILYTRRYGMDNRVKQDNITIVIENGIVKKIIESNEETQIPKEGMLATYIKPQGQKSTLPVEVTIPFKIGERVKFEYRPNLGTDWQAYECGSWIVRDGEIVIGEKDPWVGVLTNRDPRTAIGIKESGEVVLITVDGRQPGYSYGFTAQELGEFLIEYGVKDAAMLDGGASTEMIIKGELVNRPSFRGSERPLAGGIIIQVE
ncbi:MAG TPA: phosphodiester glycosidase family protein [Clostridiaceae bacterium]|nr:phosphodiester glycosidase family protein [Clostridiaceae bacterium]